MKLVCRKEPVYRVQDQDCFIACMDSYVETDDIGDLRQLIVKFSIFDQIHDIILTWNENGV